MKNCLNIHMEKKSGSWLFRRPWDQFDQQKKVVFVIYRLNKRTEWLHQSLNYYKFRDRDTSINDSGSKLLPIPSVEPVC